MGLKGRTVKFHCNEDYQIKLKKSVIIFMLCVETSVEMTFVGGWGTYEISMYLNQLFLYFSIKVLIQIEI